MTFRGTVQNGKVVFDSGASLPDGTRVDVQPARPSPPERRRRPGAPTKAKSPRGLIGLLDHAVSGDLPRDLAAQHDHYIYGTPKRKQRRTTGSKGRRR